MKKAALVLLGLLLFAGAAGTLGYRLFLEPEAGLSSRGEDLRSGTRGAFATKSEPRAAQSAQDRQAWRSLRENNRYYRPQYGGLQMFSLVMDVVNVFVGLIGIWLALWGVRTRRERTGAVKHEA